MLILPNFIKYPLENMRKERIRKNKKLDQEHVEILTHVLLTSEPYILL